LQSGSAEILKLMKRRYSIDFFKEVIDNVADNIPDVCIGNDVIVGFPGETDRHFAETYDLLQSLPISYLHVFTYSERDNTPAASYEGVVPMNIRKERTNILRELSEQKLEAFYESQIGKDKTVLPESFNESTGMWSGWTENYVRVSFPGNASMPKDFYRVKLTHKLGSKVYAKLI
jgi:threonylcarbamoyladenosine tRNA methylthiotransferase MtaB